MLDICGTQAVYVPTNECGECSAFEARVRILEERVVSLANEVNTLNSGAAAQATLNTGFRSDINTNAEGINTNTESINTLRETVTSEGTRITTLENKIGSKGDVVISKTDANGDTVAVTVLASVNS